MIFWGVRFLVLLVSLLTLIANWRIGMVLVFAMTADFFTYLWMALPLFSVRNELFALLGAGLVVGTIIAVGQKRLAPPWLAALVCASVLALLRGSLYLAGLSDGSLKLEEVLQTLPSAMLLVLGSGSAMLLPAVVSAPRSAPRQ